MKIKGSRENPQRIPTASWRNMRTDQYFQGKNDGKISHPDFFQILKKITSIIHPESEKSRKTFTS